LRSKEPSLSLRDIADAIDAIRQFTDGMDFDAFQHDLKTIAAVERKLMVISEAAIRLKDDAARLCPGAPWPEIRGIGNWLRHQYDRVELATVWHTIQDDVPMLRIAVQRALSSPPRSPETPQR